MCRMCIWCNSCMYMTFCINAYNKVLNIILVTINIEEQWFKFSKHNYDVFSSLFTVHSKFNKKPAVCLKLSFNTNNFVIEPFLQNE